MTPDSIFSWLNLIALCGWILLIFAPRWRWTSRIAGLGIPLLLAGIYAALILSEWARSEGGFSSLADVATLFSNRWLLLAGWTHYLAFDLLIGAWEARDARNHGVSHILMVPCLAMTFMFGPAGWLLYMVVRQVQATFRLSSRAAAMS